MDGLRSTAALLLCLLLPLASAWSLPSTAAAAEAAETAEAAAAATAGQSGWAPLQRETEVQTKVQTQASALSSLSSVEAVSVARQVNEVSPYLDLVICPLRPEPWSCARQQSARILDVWDGELSVQWQKLKVEADRQLNATIEKRGYSASELPLKEKPSTILKKIEIGTNYMKEYLAETMDGFLGREYEYLQTSKAADDSENDHSDNHVDYDDETDTAEAEPENNETAEDEDDVSESGEQEPDDEEGDDEPETDADNENENEAETETETAITANANAVTAVKNTALTAHDENTSAAAEFIEIEDGEEHAGGTLKKPGGGKRKQKKQKKKKKKGEQPATLVVVQAAPEHHDVVPVHDHLSSADGGDSGVSHGKPFKRKQKRGRRKKKGQQATVVVEQESSDHLGLGLLDELVDDLDVTSFGGGKRKHKNPTKYGRSNGVTRGKKKKKKKGIMKFVLLGSFLKAKIELLLKILGAHLQIKFFAIALIGLLINIARFWIDVKRGGSPSKVVYVEHAHHQHHYEDHGDDWSEQGSYWKRSLQTDPSVEDVDSSTDSYQLRPQQQQQPQDAHYLAYRNQYQWQ